MRRINNWPIIMVAIAAGLMCGSGTLRAEIFHAQGELSGEVTDSTALLQSRLTATAGLNPSGDIKGRSGVACFEWGTSADVTVAQRTEWTQAKSKNDFIIRARLTGLKPGTTYFYRLLFGEDRDTVVTGPIRSFRTLPGANANSDVQFCMGSCMNYNSFIHGKANRAAGPLTATDEDKRLGYPSFVAMAALKPDFFIGTGDIVYYDDRVNPATTLRQMRRCWHEQFRFPRLIDFFARTPGYWSKDDHDFRYDDADLVGDRLPLPGTGIDVFREQLPLLPTGDEKTPTYRTHRVSRHLQLWFTEGRDHRSPKLMEDGPGKSLWGAEQRKWLLRTLKASDATWKILISPTPMVGPDSARKKDNHTNLGGYRHEANEFFAWLKTNDIHGFLTFCGDRHWQFHSIHPSGVEEFGCGALNDENAIPGIAPGKKGSTDPDGLIKQPFKYLEPTGGFLHVVSRENGSLRVEFRDDLGTVLHTVEK